MSFNPGEARDEKGRWVGGGSLKHRKQNAQIAVDLFKRLGHDAAVYHKPGASWAAIRSNSDGRIYVNGSHKYWNDPVGNNLKHGASGYFSSTSPEHVIHHEIGHALYDPPSNFMGLQHQELARTKVSKYAAVNPKEFVSEVHAALQSGKTYSEDVMQAFKSYARPRQD